MPRPKKAPNPNSPPKLSRQDRADDLAVTKLRRKKVINTMMEVARELAPPASTIIDAAGNLLPAATVAERLGTGHTWTKPELCQGTGQKFSNIGRWQVKCLNRAHGMSDKCRRPHVMFISNRLPAHHLRQLEIIKAMHDSLGSTYGKEKSSRELQHEVVNRDDYASITGLTSAVPAPTPANIQSTQTRLNAGIQLLTPPETSPASGLINRKRQRSESPSDIQSVKKTRLAALQAWEATEQRIASGSKVINEHGREVIVIDSNSDSDSSAIQYIAREAREKVGVAKCSSSKM